jgi:sugar lactone lactonase YvrE
MKMHPVSWSGVTNILSQDKLALFLGGALLCITPGMASGQSVSFAGGQLTMPANSVQYPSGVALDSAGDVFVSDWGSNRVINLPWTGTSFGQQITVPFEGLDGSYGVAVDSKGNVFTADDYNRRVVEVPWTGTGYGAQITLPFNGSQPFGVAVDSARNLFIDEIFPVSGIVELPWTGSGYEAETMIFDHTIGLALAIALDSAGDLFISSGGVWELPKTETGFGPPKTITTFNSGPIAFDSAGDLFAGSNSTLVEFPWTGSGYGAAIVLPADSLSSAEGLAVDGSGNIFIANTQNHRVVEFQTRSVNFDKANVCGSGQTTPAPCSITLPLYFNVTASGTLGTPNVPPGDFTLAGGNTCTGKVSKGATCTVNVTFTPTALGARNGSVEITAGEGNVLATVSLYGTGVPAGTLTPPVLQVSANGNIMYFNSVAVGSSVTHSLQVFNAGSGRYAGTLTVTPSTNAQSFKVVGSSCAGGVRSAHDCWLQIEFRPVDAATIHGTLTLQNNGATAVTVALHGVGVTP